MLNIRVSCFLFFFAAEKYCKLVRDEDGVRLLQGLTESPWTSPRVRELAQITLDKCHSHAGNDADGKKVKKASEHS